MENASEYLLPEWTRRWPIPIGIGLNAFVFFVLLCPFVGFILAIGLVCTWWFWLGVGICAVCLRSWLRKNEAARTKLRRYLASRLYVIAILIGATIGGAVAYDLGTAQRMDMFSQIYWKLSPQLKKQTIPNKDGIATLTWSQAKKIESDAYNLLDLVDELGPYRAWLQFVPWGVLIGAMTGIGSVLALKFVRKQKWKLVRRSPSQHIVFGAVLFLFGLVLHFCWSSGLTSMAASFIIGTIGAILLTIGAGNCTRVHRTKQSVDDDVAMIAKPKLEARRMHPVSNVILRAWSPWYARLGAGVSALGLSFLLVTCVSSSGPTAPIHFLSAEKIEQFFSYDKSRTEAQAKEVDRYNDLFERDDTLRTRSIKYGKLVLLLECLNYVPGVMATGVLIAFIGFLIDRFRPRNK
jgi:hypothetical protein